MRWWWEVYEGMQGGAVTSADNEAVCGNNMFRNNNNKKQACNEAIAFMMPAI